MTYLKAILILLCLGYSTVTLAQNRKRYIYTPKSENKSNNKTKATDILELIPQSEKRDIYRIDILLPIHLGLLPQQIQHIKSWHEKSLGAMNFYEGVLMAVDSLEKQESMYYDIYIHDIATMNLDSLLQSEQLKKSDVVIAGVQSSQLDVLSSFALENQINTFSVFSPAEGQVKENPFFFLFQPTLTTHMTSLIQYAESQFSRYPTTILYREHPGDEIAFTLLKSQLRKKHNEYKIQEDQIDIEKLKNKLIKNERNLIYTTFISPESTTKILEQLAKIGPEYDIIVIGLPSWKTLSILNNGQLPENMTVYIPYAFKYEDDDALKKHILNSYAIYQRGYPTEFTYRGFESVMWIANMLETHGLYFNHKLQDQKVISTEFNYELAKDQQTPKFMENQKIYYFKFHKGKFDILNK